ncbi:aminotransferase class I/II-fold pyridoxal phosphate-dependent enzyme [Nitratiruptor sp. SB155-2]|uniref:aminotransferase class I/II-fold pyridoxal phosphate-dependent enzyme n=1 Tax=Nitratiruptor sp. (strain SB155-2) TaxID=387092 RepID=UPI00015871A7|nr:pyridoxal phosphate-dependent aminotransferase family protein [Nitratiruptor sp. SB155-2]BAF70630.1 8-amino-7-oxononanoate synthase [Nitratiruptor sp. SB155-2]
MYEKELKALQRSRRFRKRRLFPLDVKDFASNDYLGLAHDKELLKRAYEKVLQFSYNTSKASALINGYTPIHQAFEEALCRLNGFESCITVGSGFLANLALIESLVRKKDKLFMDEEFHASGILASRLVEQVEFFAHNDAEDLQKRLQKGGFDRAIVAVEGIYSMSGDILNPEIFEVAKDTLLIVDEAHSSGVVGKSLLGVFDYYNIKPSPMHIKMGTLGKAYASYGAYILASSEIVSYLENRAKSIIYTTALSLMDVALAHEALQEITNKREFLYKAIQKRQSIAKDFGYETPGLIVDIEKKDVLNVQQELLEQGYLVGAIRPPTVQKPIIRVIARLGESEEDFVKVLEMLS